MTGIIGCLTHLVRIYLSTTFTIAQHKAANIEKIAHMKDI